MSDRKVSSFTPTVNPFVPLTIRGQHAIVPLTKGKFAMIDVADFSLVSGRRWYAHSSKGNRTFYARHTANVDRKRKQTILMHRLIGGIDTKLIDHRNGNGLDNRRGNLRRSTVQMNRANCHAPILGSSRFVGVTWNASSQKWQASIKTAGKSKYLGLFVDEVEAAKAYDAAAIRTYGDFSRLNFPDTTTEAA